MTQLVLLHPGEPTERYLRAHTCEECGAVDASSTPGPRMLWGEPGAYTCASSLRFCQGCSSRLWTAHLARVSKLKARLERLERYKRRELPWQSLRPSWWPDGLQLRMEVA